MRIAWIGPAPSLGGGVPQVGTLLLEGLADRGHRIDCFTVPAASPLPPRIVDHPMIELVLGNREWKWDRWYSRGGASVITAASEQATRARAQHVLLKELLRRHASKPYDVVYQFSQWELLGLRRHRSVLPPIVLHPQVHAAGELRWHRRESDLSRACEPLARTLAVRTMLRGRAEIQRRDAAVADLIIAASAPFAEDLLKDYELPATKVHVVPDPIDHAAFTTGPPRGRMPGQPAEILYVSRFSVRKGVEMVVDLSHRLADLEGDVRIRVVGHTSLWSDYRPLLRDLDPRVGVVHGKAGSTEMPALYREAELVIQPSHYEPFGLTVGEALASGVPVVATECVGAAQNVHPSCCRRFQRGDRSGFEDAVRSVLAAGEAERLSMRNRARIESTRLFSPDVIAAGVESALLTAQV